MCLRIAQRYQLQGRRRASHSSCRTAEKRGWAGLPPIDRICLGRTAKEFKFHLLVTWKEEAAWLDWLTPGSPSGMRTLWLRRRRIETRVNVFVWYISVSSILTPGSSRWIYNYQMQPWGLIHFSNSNTLEWGTLLVSGHVNSPFVPRFPRA